MSTIRPASVWYTDDLIEAFKLVPHVEGGLYSEIFRTSFEASEGHTSSLSHIYYLLREGEVSHLHRLSSSEILHHYSGGPLTVIEIREDQHPKCTVIGTRFELGEVPCYIVPAGTWFGAYLPEGVSFAFVGCTVSPAFDFRTFERASLEKMVPYRSHSAYYIDLLL